MPSPLICVFNILHSLSRFVPIATTWASREPILVRGCPEPSGPSTPFHALPHCIHLPSQAQLCALLGLMAVADVLAPPPPCSFPLYPGPPRPCRFSSSFAPHSTVVPALQPACEPACPSSAFPLASLLVQWLVSRNAGPCCVDVLRKKKKRLRLKKRIID